MATGRVDRRLAAVLAADVVGYSRLVEWDEEGTLDRLRQLRREVVEPILDRHSGRVAKLMGDGALVEFPSASEAVAAAVEIQKAVAGHEHDRPEDERIRFRIGISLGDIVHEDGDIFGEAVNLAARLEQLAEPGGVCVARNVYDQARNRVSAGFAPIGRRALKNIAEPVEVWRVQPGGAARSVRPARTAGRRVRLIGAGGILLAAAIGLGGWSLLTRQEDQGHFDGNAAIAVLPFENLSADPEQSYLADGIVEDIITQLARNKDLKVIARTTSFSFRGQAMRAEEIAGELGVDYILEGSVRRAGDDLRITAQLIDGQSGEHLWAERYDRPAGEVIEVQDAIVEGIAGELFSEIRQGRKAAALRRPVRDIDNYTATVKALALKHTFDPDSFREARRLLREVLAREPDYAQAHTVLGYLDAVDAGSGVTGELGAADLDAAVDRLHRATRLDPSSGLAWQALSVALAYRGDAEGAVEASRRSLELGPSDADSHLIHAGNLAFAGQFEAAEASAAKAFELNPRPPIWYLDGRGLALFGLGRYEELAESMRECLRRDDSYFACRMLLAVAEVALGRLDQARENITALRRDSPGFTLAVVREGYSFPGAPEKTTELVANLRAAGLE